VAARRLAKSAFVNCAFAEARREIFDALIFALCYCEIKPVIAPSKPGHREPRLIFIQKQIAKCDLSIHDVTPVQDGGGDRLNTIFELGLALGDGGKRPILIFAASQTELHERCSDLKGHDIAEHGGDGVEAARLLVLELGDCFHPSDVDKLPSADDVAKDFPQMRAAIEEPAEKKGVKPSDKLSRRINLIERWVYNFAARPDKPSASAE
jgi:hypothetical protein